MFDTFGKFVKRYEDAGRDNTAKTYRSILNQFGKYLQVENKTPHDFTVQTIRNYLKQSSYSKKSKSDIISCVKRFAKWYYDFRAEDDFSEKQRLNQIQDMIRPKVPKRQSRKALRIDEIEKLLDVMNGKNASYVYLSCYFGLRPGEFQRVEDINWSDNEMIVLTEKIEVERILPFTDQVGDVYKKAMDRGWLDREYSSINRALKPYREVLNGGNRVKLTPHSGRHTFKSEMRRRCDDGIVNTLLGHSDRSVDDIYDDPAYDYLREAMIEKHYLKDLEVPKKLKG